MDVTRAHKDAALLKLLGYDPRTHAVQPVTLSGRWRGVRVVHESGRACRFVPEDRMTALGPKWRRLATQIAQATAAHQARELAKDKRRRAIATSAVVAATAAACVGVAVLL